MDRDSITMLCKATLLDPRFVHDVQDIGEAIDVDVAAQEDALVQELANIIDGESAGRVYLLYVLVNESLTKCK